MANPDRQKWNEKYEKTAPSDLAPSQLLPTLDDILPRHGRALDVAGGAGRNATWLARRGLQVTIADIADGGLAKAQQLARQNNVALDTVQTDLEQDPFPPGPWDLIVSFLFLWRPLFHAYPQHLAPGGLLVVAQPTRSNLQRHDKPPERFLLEDGELPSLVPRLEIVQYREGWLEDGRHDALLVARRNSTGTK